MTNTEPSEPTPEQIENYYQNLISKFKQDPKWELQQEFGRMLMLHIDDLSENQRARYEELKTLIKE
jgi:uncharacterized membrane-anchored protein YjiN (DUF445 family)